MPPDIDAGQYLGRRFELGGRGPDAFDCYGLVRAILDECCGVALPLAVDDYPNSTAERAALAALLQAHRGYDWLAVAQRVRCSTGTVLHRLMPEQPGDVVLCRFGQHGCHVGVVLQPGRMIHIHEGTDVTIADYHGDRWAGRVVSIHRHWTLLS